MYASFTGLIFHNYSDKYLIDNPEDPTTYSKKFLIQESSFGTAHHLSHLGAKEI